jgi:hypothetical protein
MQQLEGKFFGLSCGKYEIKDANDGKKIVYYQVYNKRGTKVGAGITVPLDVELANELTNICSIILSTVDLKKVSLVLNEMGLDKI